MMDDVCLLVRHGHKESEVWEYPLDKFRGYIKSLSRLEATRRLDYITDTQVSIVKALSSKKDAGKELTSFLEEKTE